MTEVTPIFTSLDQELVYDTSVEQTELDEIQCDRSSITNLNQANNQLKFYYAADFGFILSSPDSGFLVKCRFRTRDNNNTNMNASITLASNWFGYLFDEAILRLGQNCVEHVRQLGIVSDVFFHMSDSEFRHKNGENGCFIPDNSNEISVTIGLRIGDVAGNDVAGVIANINNNNQRNCRINKNYNEGFVRRKKLYNYTVAANDNFREIELFLPLNRIFLFCDEVNRLLKYIPFEIVLTRSGNDSHCYYGAANTAIDFGPNKSGLISIVHQLERVKLRADINSNMEKLYKHPFNVSYYKRICEQSATQAGIQSTFSCVRTFNNDDDGNPRYLFVIIKPHANDTVQSNYQGCCHANISTITARYSSNTYPLSSKKRGDSDSK